MPSTCSVVGCGASTSQNISNLSFHRLPRNETRKRKWLDAIGSDNIITENKVIFICSLHFEESSINRTLDVVRLRDDAVPYLNKQHHSVFIDCAASISIDSEPSEDSEQNLGLQHSVFVDCADSTSMDPEIPSDSEQNLVLQHSTSAQCSASLPTDLNLPSDSEPNHILDKVLKQNQLLQRKLVKQRSKIKYLSEIIRRQKIKVERSKAIIKEIKKI